MTPIGRVFWGHVLVFIDIRIEGLDVVPDPLGWLLVLAGCVSLASRHPLFRGAGVFAGGALVLSVPETFAEPGALLGLAQGGLETAVLFCICTALVQVVGGRRGRAANAIRWVDLVLLAFLAAATVVGGEREVQVRGAEAAPVLLLAAVTLGVGIWFLVTLHRVRHHPALAGTTAPAAV